MKAMKNKELKDKKMEKIFRFRRKIAVFMSVFMASFIVATPVYATDYLGPITKLKTVALSIVAAAGVIVLIYGGVKFAESFQKKDQNGEYSAIYTIVAGGILVGISAIVTALT